MKPTTKLYLKEFFINAIPFGFLLLLFDKFTNGEIIIAKYILSSFLFGTVMSYIFFRKNQKTKATIKKNYKS